MRLTLEEIKAQIESLQKKREEIIQKGLHNYYHEFRGVVLELRECERLLSDRTKKDSTPE